MRIVGTSVTQPVSASSPLLVSGSVFVANTPSVQAQQDGAWNVGINGMPNVNVANMPTVALQPGTTVPVKIAESRPAAQRICELLGPGIRILDRPKLVRWFLNLAR